jgi:hypothetical protein
MTPCFPVTVEQRPAPDRVKEGKREGRKRRRKTGKQERREGGRERGKEGRREEL